MNDYIKVLEGKAAYTSENAYRKGLRYIYNYIIISTYFADRAELYAPLPSNLNDFDGINKAKQTQKIFQELIYTLNLKLLGCVPDEGLPFLQKIDTIDLVEELGKMRDYLKSKCRHYRLKKLER